ncbi:MAG TPA: hypothetical protein DCQ28_14120, partial [Bacteroidetes bacterium]|nr:hypothetical protein [Bacteroidota bacterium]
MQNHIEFFFFRILYLFVRLISFRNVQRIGSGFGAFVFSVIGLRKKLIFDNLRKAFPEKSEEEITKIAIGSFRNLFTAYFEILYLDKLTADQIRQYISFPEIEKFKAYLHSGKGLIILTGHYANWELCAFSIPVLVPEKYTIVVQKQRNPFINDFISS